MRALLSGLLVLLALLTATPALAHGPAPIGDFPTVVLVPLEGAVFEFQGKRYGGTLELRSASDGVVLVEHTDIDGYLAGITEVPFSWPREALAAQVVAARTYLASTLAAGRAGAARTYGFDICASSACQVYTGIGNVQQTGGARWQEAVDRTAGQVLLYQGAAARTYYHSTSGGATAAIQDVWAGSAPVPYLVGAESPGEQSPFAAWRVALPTNAFEKILAAGGYATPGGLVDVGIEESSPGSGVWRARLTSVGRTWRLNVAEIRAVMNRHGPRLFPDLLPGLRPNGRRYPQAVLSYRFDMGIEVLRDRLIGEELFPADDLPPASAVVVDGRGWGHHVGMSQYGAAALADGGAGYADILGHFYGGLTPQVAPGVVPSAVAVGLAWERSRIDLVADGPFRLEVGDQVVFTSGGGEWSIVDHPRSGLGLVPPEAQVVALTKALRPGRPLL